MRRSRPPQHLRIASDTDTEHGPAIVSLQQVREARQVATDYEAEVGRQLTAVRRHKAAVTATLSPAGLVASYDRDLWAAFGLTDPEPPGDTA